MGDERLKPISLHQEMQRSYLEYAMSVIVGRALPDARDGLKPVQRRILFAMHELGLTPDKPFRKCARVVGDVLGKYHPHGDQAVYDALVRQVQDFTSRYPILDGHGNFGSIDDDPAAAMRYTETRLAEISHQAILSEIDSNTVEFSPNFDGSQQEPNVLPAQLPFLILNGCSGIAVGMATSIPPHNLNEVIDALTALIKTPNMTDEKLLKIIPGPDFPTGGEILLSHGIKDMYLKGKGSVPMRGVTHIEEIYPGKGKHKRSAVIVTELPYQTNKSSWIEKLAEAVNNGKINGIADIRDESDREGMRILIELKRDSNPSKILEFLYQKTSLQSNFGAILLALVNGQPIQLTLKQLLSNFLEFRELTVLKRTKFKLKKIKDRQEIVEALAKAIRELRKIILLIEQSKDTVEAKSKIMNELLVNERQADGILSMPLKKLTSLEQESLKIEVKDLKLKRQVLEEIINNRDLLLQGIIEELKLLKKRFNSKRKTKLIEGGDELLAEKNANQRPNRELQRIQAFDSISNDAQIVIQLNDQVKIINPNTLKRLKLDQSSLLQKDTITARLIWPAQNQPKVLAITNNGKIGIVQWEFAGKNPGKIDSFLPSGLENEQIINLIPVQNIRANNLGLITSDGKFKRIGLNEFNDISHRSTSILKLKNSVKLKSAILCNNNHYLIIVTNIGRILKLKINEIDMPIMGKLSQGYLLTRLFPEETIIGTNSTSGENAEDLILINNKGAFIKIKIKSLKESRKGDLGSMPIINNIIKNKSSRIIYSSLDNQLISIMTNQGRQARIGKELLNTLEYKLEKQILILNNNETIDLIAPLILKN